MSYESGIKAEHYVFDRFNKENIGYTFDDEWYDVMLSNNEKLEIKSCCLSVKHKIVKNGKTQNNFRIGRFDFTKEENREKLQECNAWICFVTRFKEEHLICGFCRATQLNTKKRYVTIHHLRNINLLNFDEWKDKLK